jgi:hypothetical protein
MFRNLKSIVIVSAIVLINAPDGDAGGMLRIRSSAAPPDIYVYVSVERRAENRRLVVSAQSADFFGRSTVQLEGEYSARVATFHFRHVPPGIYDVEAELIDSEGHTRDVARSALFIP